MGIKEKFFKKTIFLDTAPLIYFIEKNKQYHKRLLSLFHLNDVGDIIIQTSTLTLMEVSVLPLKKNQKRLAAQYEQILTTSPNIEMYTI